MGRDDHRTMTVRVRHHADRLAVDAGQTLLLQYLPGCALRDQPALIEQDQSIGMSGCEIQVMHHGDHAVPA